MIHTLWLPILLISTFVVDAQELTQMDRSSRSSVGLPISGRVLSNDRLELSLLRVQLIDMSSNRILSESTLDISGGFQLPAKPIGLYELKIIGQTGQTLYTLDIQSATTSYLEIKLPQQNLNSQPATISAQRLKHKTHKKAQQQIELATKHYKNGDRPKTIEHLLAGAAIDMDNFDILSNLGALYLKDRDPDKAFPWLDKAWRIDPNDSPNNTNLSAYYVYKDDYAKAEEFAAASLRANPNSTHARYMLAVSLLKQGKNTEGARTHLDQIQGSFAPAKNLLLSLQPKE